MKAEMGDVDDKDMREYYAGDVSGGSDNEMNVAVLEEDGVVIYSGVQELRTVQL